MNAQLIEALKETRARTLELIDDLTDSQLIGPRLQIVNPLQWEIGHVAWFQEFWVLRHLRGNRRFSNMETSFTIQRALPTTRVGTCRYSTETKPLLTWSEFLRRVIEQASSRAPNLKDAEGYDQEYFLNLVLLHEQMHDEAITYTRQTLSYACTCNQYCRKAQ